MATVATRVRVYVVVSGVTGGTDRSKRAGQAQPDQRRAEQRRARIVVAAAMLDDDAHAAFLSPTHAMG